MWLPEQSIVVVNRQFRSYTVGRLLNGGADDNRPLEPNRRLWLLLGLTVLLVGL